MYIQKNLTSGLQSNEDQLSRRLEGGHSLDSDRFEHVRYCVESKQNGSHKMGMQTSNSICMASEARVCRRTAFAASELIQAWHLSSKIKRHTPELKRHMLR